MIFSVYYRYYSATIIQMTGVRDQSTAIWLAAVTAFVNFIFTLVGVWLVDKIGRRKLILSSLGGIKYTYINILLMRGMHPYFFTSCILIFKSMCCDIWCQKSRILIGGVMVSLLASSAVDRGYECCSDPTKDSRTGNFMSKSKDWLVRYQHNMSEWCDMSTHRLFFFLNELAL